VQSIDVIGGSGFIGSRLVRRLSSNKNLSLNIIDIVSSNVYPNIVKIGDVRSLESLRKVVSYDSVIINLAAEHRDDIRSPKIYDDVNVFGARNICKVAREKKVRTIIFTSSVAVYGFAPLGTNESGRVAPFGDYGRTKFEAEEIFTQWQSENPSERTLVIIRPTVVFGENNRGNVYNLFQRIASGKFVMVGDGNNYKSMAYVENLAAFIEFVISFKAGVHIYNFVDKPDFSMNELVSRVNQILGRSSWSGTRIPFFVGLLVGKGFDLLTFLTGKSFTLSSIRVRKFCANSVYDSSINQTGFVSPISLDSALEKTVRYEFMNNPSGRSN
jgi:GlcNAc-P-P-Und epimerase